MHRQQMVDSRHPDRGVSSDAHIFGACAMADGGSQPGTALDT